MKVTTRIGKENRAKMQSQVELLKQFMEGFVLEANDTLQEEIRPIEIIQALLPGREITGSDYLMAVKNQADEELMAAVQLGKMYQDLRQAARKMYQFTGRNKSMVARFKMLLGIAPKSHSN